MDDWLIHYLSDADAATVADEQRAADMVRGKLPREVHTLCGVGAYFFAAWRRQADEVDDFTARMGRER